MGPPDITDMRIVAALLLAGALALNAMANLLPLGGRTTGEVSALYPTLFTPAGFTFSIWGVIYLLLVAWTLAQFLPSYAATARRIAPAFALSCALNGAWLLAWHHLRIGLSMAVMVALLAVVLRINLHLEEEGRLLPRSAFGLYLGWLCVAAVANAAVLLVAVGWEGGGIPPAVWAGLLVLAGGGVGAFVALRLRNPLVGAAVVWGLVGIAAARWTDHPGVAVTALLVAGAVGGVSLLARRPRAPGVASAG
jgi:translocator protein